MIFSSSSVSLQIEMWNKVQTELGKKKKVYVSASETGKGKLFQHILCAWSVW